MLAMANIGNFPTTEFSLSSRQSRQEAAKESSIITKRLNYLADMLLKAISLLVGSSCSKLEPML